MNMIEYEHEKHLNNKYMSFLHTSEPLLKCSYKSILYTCNYHFKTVATTKTLRKIQQSISTRVL